jgi:hypothetical protein
MNGRQADAKGISRGGSDLEHPDLPRSHIGGGQKDLEGLARIQTVEVNRLRKHVAKWIDIERVGSARRPLPRDASVY